MTEQKWKEGTDPRALLYQLRGTRTDRKVRLFTVACCRLNWHRITDWRCRRAIDIAEYFADDRITQEELDKARRMLKVGRKLSGASLVSAALTYFDTAPDIAALNAVLLATRIRGAELGIEETSVRVPMKEEAALIRDIFGNPFDPVVIDQSWITATVLQLAESIYQDRAFDRMPILGDALEEAGCDSQEVLRHCREDGVHVRGCWVVDAITGRA